MPSLLEPIVRFFGFSVTIIVVSSTQVVIPTILGYIGTIQRDSTNRFNKWILKNLSTIYIIFGIILAFSFFLNFGLQDFMEKEIEKQYKPDFLMIDEKIIDEIKIDWGANDPAYVARDKFRSGVIAIRGKNMSESRACFEESIRKCHIASEEKLKILIAASFNNLLIVEYLDADYERLKATKLDKMKTLLKEALNFDTKNEKILKNQDYVDLHITLFKALQK